MHFEKAGTQIGSFRASKGCRVTFGARNQIKKDVFFSVHFFLREPLFYNAVGGYLCKNLTGIFPIIIRSN